MDRQSIFINCPFEGWDEKLFIALVGSLVAVGLTPRCAIEIGASEHARVDKIRKLLRDCAYLLHELSIVDEKPRLNMPFELGIAFEISKYTKSPKHVFGLLEAKPHRHKVNLSDLAGYDAFVHNNTQKGVIQSVLAFVKTDNPKVTFKNVSAVVKELQKASNNLLDRERRTSVFNSHIYPMLVSEAVLIRVKTMGD